LATHRQGAVRGWFQSSPARGGGCNAVMPQMASMPSPFQSSPARGGGCNVQGGAIQWMGQAVSILTRPWGRVQQTKHIHIGASHPFQSSPARGGGCNHHRLTTAHRPHAFQSSPARGGGCNAQERDKYAQAAAFQSSPARGGGCNPIDPEVVAGVVGVSILTRPWGRVQHGHAL